MNIGLTLPPCLEVGEHQQFARATFHRKSCLFLIYPHMKQQQQRPTSRRWQMTLTICIVLVADTTSQRAVCVLLSPWVHCPMWQITRLVCKPTLPQYLAQNTKQARHSKWFSSLCWSIISKQKKKKRSKFDPFRSLWERIVWKPFLGFL